MGWIAEIFKGSADGIIGGIGKIADELHLSGEEKQNFQVKMESLLQKRDSEIEQTIRTELTAKSNIIMAEMQQGDNFTRRARPTVVYAGLFIIAVNYCFGPVIANLFGNAWNPIQMPTEFWVAWGGIVSTWVVGRSAEKRGTRSKLTSVITGNKSLFE
jgi:hypothetical protein